MHLIRHSKAKSVTEMSIIGSITATIRHTATVFIPVPSSTTHYTIRTT